MNTRLYPETLLTNRNMHAGDILQELTLDALRGSIEKLVGAIEMRGGTLTKPLILLCRADMSRALKDVYEDLVCATTDDVMDKAEYTTGLLCVVTDEEQFPEHYIVLSDVENFRGYMNGGNYAPHAALIAVKGFVPNRSIIAPYEAEDLNQIAWDIISRVEKQEFASSEHDSLRSMTIYSDFMHMTLIHEGVVKERMFLDLVPVKVKHNSAKRDHILLEFKSGLSVTLMTQEEYHDHEEKETEKVASMQGDLRSTVLDGLFGK